MTALKHVARWSLGGAFALLAGLAAAEAPAPGVMPWTTASLQLEAPLRLSVAPAALVQPMQVAPMRPLARVLASVPVTVVVQHGAAVRPEARPVFTAAAAWDDRGEGQAWSVAAMRAIDAAPHDLREVVPADIDAWCPGYERNPAHLRAAFWVGAVSALARYESTYNERAAGGGGAWIGLLQISPGTARSYGCEATSPEALKDGRANLACGIRIMSRTVSRDNVVTAGGGGIAADWGPMSNARLRDRIRGWVSEQSYCEPNRALLASLRPEARPDVAAVEVASLLPGDLMRANLPH